MSGWALFHTWAVCVSLSRCDDSVCSGRYGRDPELLGGDRHMYIQPVPNKDRETGLALGDVALHGIPHFSNTTSKRRASCVFPSVGTLVSALCFYFELRHGEMVSVHRTT